MSISAVQALLVPIIITLLLALAISGLAWTIAKLTTRLIRHRGWRRVISIIIHGVLFFSLITMGANYYVYRGFGYQGDIYRQGDPTKPWVAITFDDGPSREFTPQILDILRDYEVPATFFMVGLHVDKYPDIARRVVEEGHEVGNHTYTHINVPTASTRRLTQELVHTTHAILDVTGGYPVYARPPRGMYDGRYRRLTAVQGQSVVLWTLSAQDWQVGVGKDQVIRRILGHVKPGDIILFHDSGALISHEGASRKATVDALPAIIEGIRAKGLEIVPLATLLKAADPVPHTEDIVLDRIE